MSFLKIIGCCFLGCLLALLIYKSAYAAIPTAIATLESKSGSNVKGVVYFEETTNGVKVSYNISNLVPNQKHGFHIHEKGDCSSDDAITAGKHYMPIAKRGGTASDSPRKHAGDLPELTADANGVAKGKFVVNTLTINNRNLIRGRAILVHGGPDDITKVAPPRVACGVIKLDRAKVNTTNPESPTSSSEAM